MEQYMSKTRKNYGSGVARPKIDNKDQLLKGQFLKELRENTFGGSDNEDANEHIEKVSKSLTYSMFLTSLGRSTKTSDGLAAIQAQLNNLGREIKKVNKKVYAAQVGCEQCKGPHYTKDFPLKEEGKTLEEAYYTQFGRPFQGGGYKATAPGYYQRNNTNPSYQEQRQSMKDTLNVAIRNQGASIKTLETQIGQMSKLIHTRYAVLDHPNTPYPNRFPNRLDNHYCEEEEEGNYGPKFAEAYGASHIN
ncbi:hypothetical protein Tco_1485876, partial [Tanacetum coccineum]